MSEKPLSREQRRKAIEQQKKASKKQTPKNPKKAAGGSWFKRILMAVVAIGVFVLLCGVGLFAFYASSAPELDEELLRDPISPTFIAADGETEIPYITAENRTHVEYEDIPKAMEDAILATEDNRFYEHSGIDVIRLGGAVIANITGGFGSQGASTITQQVIKNSFLSNDKTLKRKAQEAYLAFKLERAYSKEEIFEMYFNKILMSGNTYGFGTAAETFYGKPVSELELPEAALLAGMPQSPNGYNPFKNPERAEKRRNVVLSLMEQHGKITTAEKEQAQAASVTETLVPENQRAATVDNGEYTAFMEMVEDELDSLEGDYALDDGLTIYTTLDPSVQKTVNETMSSDMFFDDKVQSALTVVDTKTGAIRAIGAGRDYSGDVRINYATAKDRAVGSTIKPLIDYGPAIEYLDWSTGETVVDEPYSYESGQQIRNVDGDFLGTMTIREALYRSRNIPAVKTLQEVGTDNAAEFTKKIGLNLENVYESTALSADNISTVEMAGAFAAFGNGGVYTKPHTITKIVFRDGTTEQVVKPESVPAMKDSTAYMVTDMLRDVVDPNLRGSTGKEAAISGLDLAGKTGTSNYTEKELNDYGLDTSSAPDIWFAGYSPKYSISVWSGYPTRKVGIDTASDERLISQRIFKEVMLGISSNSGQFEKPDSVVELQVEAGSSPLKLASAYTPYSLRRTELFVRGSEPNQVSQRYVKEDLDTPSGLRASVDGNTVNLSWNYDDTDGVAFRVTVEVDGNRSTLDTTSSQSFSYSGLEEGKTYTFRVTAVSNNDASDPASVRVSIAAPEEPEEEPAEEPEEEPAEPEEPVEEPAEEEPIEPEEPAEDEEQPEQPADDEGDGGNEGNGNEGNGNGNGNENGNGNGNEGGGNGNGNGEGGETPPADGGEGDANPASVPPADETEQPQP
ncbi:PBP1A family penicillin-binding protein [Planomicrobium chinense]|uniref:PBP1A family penicillin-binding protein n=1 Tax=Planococcus chinensis TaxID=272917 RepID=UPI001CC522CF|nr:penicillin-binding protein 1A [Planococcus chinensis]MBZ5202242.1 PBP1A family penicillin-binding protein [Planococcus chinensis]